MGDSQKASGESCSLLDYNLPSAQACRLEEGAPPAGGGQGKSLTLIGYSLWGCEGNCQKWDWPQWGIWSASGGISIGSRRNSSDSSLLR